MPPQSSALDCLSKLACWPQTTIGNRYWTLTSSFYNPPCKHEQWSQFGCVLWASLCVCMLSPICPWTLNGFADMHLLMFMFTHKHTHIQTRTLCHTHTHTLRLFWSVFAWAQSAERWGLSWCRAPVMSKHWVARAKINGEALPLVQQSAGCTRAAGLFVPNGASKISKASHPEDASIWQILN